MTKRMLSLLLALVMTLSLCVPALAADEFAAEAVTEVEEQAPEAPEAPVEPEAEEPAEEPVVDEPAAEEPAEVVEDVPEMASLIPEELTDEPLLVALGVVSNEAHWDLYRAVQKAEKIMPDVEAGKVYSKGSLSSLVLATAIKTYNPDKPETHPLAKATADFKAAYETAKKYLDGVNGKEVDFEVTTATVQPVANALLAYVQKGGSKELLDEIDGTEGSGHTQKGQLQAMLDEVAHYTYDATNSLAIDALKPGSPLNAKASLTSSSQIDTNKTLYEQCYHADYLTELKTVLDDIDSYDEKTYADFSALVDAILKIKVDEAVSARPAASDMSALDSVLARANAVKDTYADNKDDYVIGTTAAANFSTYITNANRQKSESGGLNGFATAATYYSYNKAIKDLEEALQKKTNTIAIESNKITNASGGEFDLVISVTKFDGTSSGTDGDGKDYGIAYKIGGKWYNNQNSADETGTDTVVSEMADTTNKNIIPITKGSFVTDTKSDTKYVQSLQLHSLKSGGNYNAISVGDLVTVQFYEKVGSSDGSTERWQKVGGEQTISLTNNYDGPVIKKVEIASGDYKGTTAKLKGTYTDTNNLITDINFASLISSNLTDYSTGDEVQPTVTMTLTTNVTAAMGSTKYRFNVLDASGKIVAYPSNSDTVATTLSNTGTVKLPTYLDEYLVGGSVLKVQLAVATTETSPAYGDYIPQGTAVTLKVNPLSKWGEVATIKEVLEDVGEMVDADYEFNSTVTVARPADVTTAASAFTVMRNAATLINNAINNASLANSMKNRNTVLQYLRDLFAARSALKVKTIDTKELDRLVAEAKDILKSKDADDYTFDSWGALHDLVDETDAVAAITAAKKLQSTTDEYAAKIEAAIKALKGEAEPDKTSLNSSIAAAKALKEADYTPESWAAAKTEIDAALATAETVAANETATQAQIDAAKAALDAAVAKLVKVDEEDEPPAEGPKAPSSGTGWTTYNGDIYFFKNGTMVKDYWVGNAVGASKWANNWYYVGSDGKLATGFQYIDDLKGGKAWYMLQTDNTNGEIGKMLTGWKWTYSAAGTGYFSPNYGSQGMCTYTSEWGSYNATTGLWADGLAHR